MGDQSKIEWTDATWNPIRGCSRVSEGCRFCYAERVAARFSGIGMPYEGLAVVKSDGPHWTGEVRFIEERLGDPLRWRKPRRIFVNSMSDLFHEKLNTDAIVRICEVMGRAKQHIFQVLTKRPERMLGLLTDLQAFGGNPPGHIWWGVSVEDQATADERIPLLLQTPAAVRWVSYEPALGPVDFTAIRRTRAEGFMRPLDGRFNKLDWIVAGGESGHGARPAHPDWFRSVRDQCVAAGVPFFFKQWGEWRPKEKRGYGSIGFFNDGTEVERVGKKAAGRLLDGREWNQYPEFK
jgi:protein gp37